MCVDYIIVGCLFACMFLLAAGNAIWHWHLRTPVKWGMTAVACVPAIALIAIILIAIRDC